MEVLTWSSRAVTFYVVHQTTVADAFSWLSLLIAHQPTVSEMKCDNRKINGTIV